MSWEAVRYELLETGWFEWEDRPKTVRAIQRVMERMSDDEVDVLCARVQFIIARHPKTLGENMVIFARDETEERVIVYFPGSVERRSQRVVNYVVAHEFAHALLLHAHRVMELDQETRERQADEKAEAWGFPRQAL